jgi:hypothetical protein
LAYHFRSEIYCYTLKQGVFERYLEAEVSFQIYFEMSIFRQGLMDAWVSQVWLIREMFYIKNLLLLLL